MSDDSLRATHRILDASANRASEGLRTLEEFARFLLDDADLSQQLKLLRHDLTSAIGRIPREKLLASRDTAGDVGTEIQTAGEYRREDLAAVVAAAAARSQQSLRVLEEYGKTMDGQFAAEIEQIRYRCYTLSAELELRLMGSGRRERLASSCLYLLIEAQPTEHDFVEMMAGLADAGVDIFQLRDRSADDRTLLSRAKIGTRVANQHGALLIVNDRPDLAAAAGADGVHVGQEEMPAAEAHRIVGHQQLVGVSTHSIDQAHAAISDGADYIGCGPVFASRTKSFDSFAGPEFLSQVSQSVDLPAFAIGGIDETNVDQVIRSGVHRIAVSGAIRDAADPRTTARQLKARLLESAAENSAE